SRVPTKACDLCRTDQQTASSSCRERHPCLPGHPKNKSSQAFEASINVPKKEEREGNHLLSLLAIHCQRGRAGERNEEQTARALVPTKKPKVRDERQNI